jgi:hypothetical protein
MADPRQRRSQLWPWRRRTTTGTTTATPPTAQGLAEKLAELAQFERGVAALYYYLPDESLATLAQDLCQSHRAASRMESGVDRDLRAKDAALEAWRGVRAIWLSEIWKPGEILAMFGVRLIEALRAENELWSVVVDAQAQFFGLAATTDEAHRYWLVLVTGEKGQEMDAGGATVAR